MEMQQYDKEAVGPSLEELASPEVYHGEEGDMEEPEPEDRDPEGINAHVKLELDQVIAEPEGLHTHRVVWGCTRIIYNALKYGVYFVVTLLFGWAAAILWGCCFAWTGLCHVWCLTPGYRVSQIFGHSCYRQFRLITRCCCDPLCEAYAKLLSNIRVTHHHVTDNGDNVAVFSEV